MQDRSGQQYNNIIFTFETLFKRLKHFDKIIEMSLESYVNMYHRTAYHKIYYRQLSRVSILPYNY